MKCKCGHEDKDHAPVSGCMLFDCECRRFALVEEPEEETSVSAGGSVLRLGPGEIVESPAFSLGPARTDDPDDSMLIVGFAAMAFSGFLVGVAVGLGSALWGWLL